MSGGGSVGLMCAAYNSFFGAAVLWRPAAPGADSWVATAGLGIFVTCLLFGGLLLLIAGVLNFIRGNHKHGV